jgi:hypothetical protein
MRIAIVSDAWFPQVNGVVRPLDTVRQKLVEAGHELLVIGPDRFHTLPCPTYPEIRLALLAGRALQRFGVFEAGVESTRDPKYVVVPQRERLEAGTPARGADRPPQVPRLVGAARNVRAAPARVLGGGLSRQPGRGAGGICCPGCEGRSAVPRLGSG